MGCGRCSRRRPPVPSGGTDGRRQARDRSQWWWWVEPAVAVASLDAHSAGVSVFIDSA